MEYAQSSRVTACLSSFALYLVLVSYKVHVAVCGADLKSIWLVDSIFSSFD